jgi:hypothetical protein
MITIIQKDKTTYLSLSRILAVEKYPNGKVVLQLTEADSIDLVDLDPAELHRLLSTLETLNDPQGRIGTIKIDMTQGKGEEAIAPTPEPEPPSPKPPIAPKK